MSFTFTHVFKMLSDGELDLRNAGDDIRVLLITGSAPTAGGGATLDALSFTEASGTGYERKSLTGRTTTTASGRVEFKADNVTWEEIETTETLTGMIIYVHNDANDNQNVPLFFKDSGFPFETTGGDLTIVWDDDGIVHIQEPD